MGVKPVITLNGKNGRTAASKKLLKMGSRISLMSKKLTIDRAEFLKILAKANPGTYTPQPAKNKYRQYKCSKTWWKK
jgi:hypothetical protein